ncbi:hypothetical protein JTE90_015504 [Oedothorax gibbosus]|uniref:Uncharacterized protein n=1 Tax=Oedothorax gibbosus TaxID=931172 RepID=A0AAV6VSF4_9ARAC|nr:hypothetical protein JTE90_015504 [Oedothorax gibbosus]
MYRDREKSVGSPWKIEALASRAYSVIVPWIWQKHQGNFHLFLRKTNYPFLSADLSLNAASPKTNLQSSLHKSSPSEMPIHHGAPMPCQWGLQDCRKRKPSIEETSRTFPLFLFFQ